MARGGDEQRGGSWRGRGAPGGVLGVVLAAPFALVAAAILLAGALAPRGRAATSRRRPF